MARYLDPKNDVVFKKIFGQNPHLLISFLNSQLTFEDDSVIESLEYLPSELIPETPAKKRTIVDVRCKDNRGRQFIVEMQMEWVTAFFERMLYNTAGLYSRQLELGDDYILLQPVYGLAILNKNFDKETDEYYHKFEMLNPKNPDEKISGITIVAVELKKLVPKTSEEKKLAVLWLRFLKETNESVREISPELQENPIIKEAVKLCEAAAYTDVERAEYDKCKDEILRENMLIEGKFAEGIEKGIEKGKAERNIEIALNMLRDSVPFEIISKFTGLSISEIQNLKFDLKI
ncbi:MAG: Rpn family recombination-promoting nuclease/putative transposase [Prevotellaceae bacterium]|jgi:predicted transposase/invertase (TIGR01784 family)|nr:Rpn family recombination-promoting nuclease/putative transposase [Prevotellaceae bacterium]